MRLCCSCAGMWCWLGVVCSWDHIRPLADVEANPHQEMIMTCYCAGIV
jgi:hypothetical protein